MAPLIKLMIWAVEIANTIKIITAIKGEGDNEASSQIPCLEVHPLDILEPKPTRTPPIRSWVGLMLELKYTDGSNKYDQINAPRIKPNAQASLHVLELIKFGC